MKKSKVVFIPSDEDNLKYVYQLQNSLRKFHTEEELPLIRYDNPDPQDKDFFYRATPIIANELLKDYETVIKMDADQIVTGKLDHLWEGDFDVAVVQNSNPREFKSFPYRFLNINYLEYVNCGLVVMRNPYFVNAWLKLCHQSIFYGCQMREQDLLNILVLQNYNVKYLDASDKWNGLISKGYWPQVELRDGKLILPKSEEWPLDEDKEICVIHFAGGNDPNKGNYKIRFKEDVIKRLDELIK